MPVATAARGFSSLADEQADEGKGERMLMDRLLAPQLLDLTDLIANSSNDESKANALGENRFRDWRTNLRFRFHSALGRAIN